MSEEKGDGWAGCAVIICIILALSPWGLPIIGIMLCVGFVALAVWFVTLGPIILIEAIRRLFR